MSYRSLGAALLALATGALTVALGPHANATTSDAIPASLATCASTRESGHAVDGLLGLDQTKAALGHLTAPHRASRAVNSGPDAVGPSLADVPPHPSQGTSFKHVEGNDGACATHSVINNFRTSKDTTTLYSPTMFPPGDSKSPDNKHDGACIELVTAYFADKAFIGAWGWCKAKTEDTNFERSVAIDNGFIATYTDGTNKYTGRVIRTEAPPKNTWVASLYNYKTKAWDQIFTMSGWNANGRKTGWNIDELYTKYDKNNVSDACRDSKGKFYESEGISVRNNGTWALANDKTADGQYDKPESDYGCAARKFVRTDWSHWRANY